MRLPGAVSGWRVKAALGDAPKQRSGFQQKYPDQPWLGVGGALSAASCLAS